MSRETEGRQSILEQLARDEIVAVSLMEWQACLERLGISAQRAERVELGLDRKSRRYNTGSSICIM